MTSGCHFVGESGVEERAGPSSQPPQFSLFHSEQLNSVIHPSLIFSSPTVANLFKCVWSHLLTIKLRRSLSSITFWESPDMTSGDDAVRPFVCPCFRLPDQSSALIDLGGPFLETCRQLWLCASGLAWHAWLANEGPGKIHFRTVVLNRSLVLVLLAGTKLPRPRGQS